MAQEHEFKLISGDEKQINQTLAIEGLERWKQILLTSIVTGQTVTLHVMLDRVITSKD